VIRAGIATLVVALAGCGGGGDECGPGTEWDGDRCVIAGVDGAPGDPDARPGSPDARVDARPHADAVPHPDAASGPRVFVTSLRYPANLRDAGGGATGRESADLICQTLADAAAIGGTFRAWLSTTDEDAIDHIQGNGPWYRMDGALVFPNRASLATTPMAAISVDEHLGHPDPFYESWTGTALGGHLAPLGNRLSVTCWDWTSTVDSTQVGGMLGLFGTVNQDGTGPDWTQYAVGYCSPFARHLYCFEQ